MVTNEPEINQDFMEQLRKGSEGHKLIYSILIPVIACIMFGICCVVGDVPYSEIEQCLPYIPLFILVLLIPFLIIYYPYQKKKWMYKSYEKGNIGVRKATIKKIKTVMTLESYNEKTRIRFNHMCFILTDGHRCYKSKKYLKLEHDDYLNFKNKIEEGDTRTFYRKNGIDNDEDLNIFIERNNINIDERVQKNNFRNRIMKGNNGEYFLNGKQYNIGDEVKIYVDLEHKWNYITEIEYLKEINFF